MLKMDHFEDRLSCGSFIKGGDLDQSFNRSFSAEPVS